MRCCLLPCKTIPWPLNPSGTTSCYSTQYKHLPEVNKSFCDLCSLTHTLTFLPENNKSPKQSPVSPSLTSNPLLSSSCSPLGRSNSSTNSGRAQTRHRKRQKATGNFRSVMNHPCPRKIKTLAVLDGSGLPSIPLAKFDTAHTKGTPSFTALKAPHSWHPVTLTHTATTTTTSKKNSFSRQQKSRKKTFPLFSPASASREFHRG